MKITSSLKPGQSMLFSSAKMHIMLHQVNQIKDAENNLETTALKQKVQEPIILLQPPEKL